MNNLSIHNSLVAFSFLILMLGCGGGGSGSDEEMPIQTAELSKLDLSIGLFTEEFTTSKFDYFAILAFSTSSIRIIAEQDSAGVISVDGILLQSGNVSQPIELMEGNNFIDVIVTSPNGQVSNTYTLSLYRQSQEQFTQQAFIKASNSNAEDRFGHAIALDGNTLVVGAIGEDSAIQIEQNNNAGASRGAVYVFVHQNGDWLQQAYLKAPNGDDYDNFGSSVSLDDDTLVIGARGERGNSAGVNGDPLDNSMEDAGAAYIFVRVGETWEQQAYLKSANPTRNERFGSSVAISGDTVAVGAVGTFFEPLSGTVYLFNRDAGLWTEAGSLIASNAEPGDEFGTALAFDGNTLAIAAKGEDSSASGINGDQTLNDSVNSGAVYIFEKNIEWTQKAYIKASHPNLEDSFGWSIDFENDTLVVGAIHQSSEIGSNDSTETLFHSGAAYVFVRNFGSWRQEAFIKASNASEEDHFGFSIAYSNDRLLVGSNGENSRVSGVNADESGNITFNGREDYWADGAAYLYQRQNGIWNQVAFYKASNVQLSPAFGYDVALTDSHAIVGSKNENSAGNGINPEQDVINPAENSGAIYIFPAN